MCTGRIDLAFILRAFLNGADGVMIGGCWPGECHYVTEGNYDALGNVHLCRKLLDRIGVNPERLRIEWIAASEGIRFAEVMNHFVDKLKELGPIGKSEGVAEKRLRLNLQAVDRIIPYIKLVEREKLRVAVKSEEAYTTFYDSEGFDRLFNQLIADKLAVSQMMLLLAEGPRSTGEISAALDLTPSEVAGYLQDSSNRGLVTYDVKRQCYALA
jgi:coenzyme F420-reducing hydrogenase delta subunit